MKPLILHGHERAITQIRFNREGDLLFSASKDKEPNVWYTINGERLGTFIGHNGAVWSIDCNWDSTRVATAGGDSTLRLWDLQTGKELSKRETQTSTRTVNYSYSANLLLYTTDTQRNIPSQIHVLDTREDIASVQPAVSISDVGTHKPTASIFGPLDDSFITGHENGSISKWECRMPRSLVLSQVSHKGAINDLQFSQDQTMFISASKDNSSKVFDTDTLDELKVFKVERPVNSAAFSPIREHIILGGGQEAMEVTTSAVKAGKFEARLFHLVFEEEFARVKGHFGPINSLAFFPDGKGYASGGEDGYVRVHNFDDTYFQFNLEC